MAVNHTFACRQDMFIQFLHSANFWDSTSSFWLGGSKNVGEFDPSHIFSYNSLTYKPKCTKFEKFLQKGSLHKPYKFYWNRAKFANFVILCVFFGPETLKYGWSYQYEIWHSILVPYAVRNFTTPLIHQTSCPRGKPQNRHLSKFNTGAAAAGKYANYLNNISTQTHWYIHLWLAIYGKHGTFILFFTHNT